MKKFYIIVRHDETNNRDFAYPMTTTNKEYAQFVVGQIKRHMPKRDAKNISIREIKGTEIARAGVKTIVGIMDNTSDFRNFRRKKPLELGKE